MVVKTKEIRVIIVEDFKLTRVGLRCALNENEDINKLIGEKIKYVKSLSNEVAKPIPDPYTYGVYPSANKLYLNQAVPANAILHSTPSEALADWTNPNVMNKASSKPYYLKHKIENDVVTESYVVFTVTDEMAQANPGMTAGTYELRGYTDGTYFIQNAKTIYDAFGTNCSLNPYTTTHH